MVQPPWPGQAPTFGAELAVTWDALRRRRLIPRVTLTRGELQEGGDATRAPRLGLWK